MQGWPVQCVIYRRIISPAAGLKHYNVDVGIVAQTVRKYTPGAAASNDDVVNPTFGYRGIARAAHRDRYYLLSKDTSGSRHAKTGGNSGTEEVASVQAASAKCSNDVVGFHNERTNLPAIGKFQAIGTWL